MIERPESDELAQYACLLPHLPDFRLFVSFRTVENARFTRIECRFTDRKNGSVSGPNRGVSGGALRSIEKKFFITSIFIVGSFQLLS